MADLWASFVVVEKNGKQRAKSGGRQAIEPLPLCQLFEIQAGESKQSLHAQLCQPPVLRVPQPVLDLRVSKYPFDGLFAKGIDFFALV